MFVLVLGRSKSGKSRFAEGLAAGMANGPLLYYATFIPVGQGIEGDATIQKHRAQRAGYNFTTVEQPLRLCATPPAKNSTVLLEDVSNLLGNNLFCPEGKAARGAEQDLLEFIDLSENHVAVSISGLVHEPGFDEATCGYIDELNRLNEVLIAKADTVVEMQDGEPVVRKGRLPQYT